MSLRCSVGRLWGLQTRAVLLSPIPSQMLSSQSEISASPEMAPLPQIAFRICVRMSTMCMFNMWPLITARQSIKAIRATGAWARSMCWQNDTQTHQRTLSTFSGVAISRQFLKYGCRGWRRCCPVDQGLTSWLVWTVTAKLWFLRTETLGTRSNITLVSMSFFNLFFITRIFCKSARLIYNQGWYGW